MQDIYDTYLEKEDTFREKQQRLDRLIRRHQHSLMELEAKRPGWYVDVVIPLAEAISKAIEMPYEVYGPFGLSAHTSIYFFINGEVKSITEEPTLGITLYPNIQGDWTSDASPSRRFFLTYDTGERTRQYCPGSLGELNDGNVVTKPLPDRLDDVIQLLRRCH